MDVIEMCYWYDYNLKKRQCTCRKEHRASLRCHSKNEGCPDYANEEKGQNIEAYEEAVREEHFDDGGGYRYIR